MNNGVVTLIAMACVLSCYHQALISSTNQNQSIQNALRLRHWVKQAWSLSLDYEFCACGHAPVCVCARERARTHFGASILCAMHHGASKHICVCAYECAHVFVCVRACARVCMRACMLVCLRVCMSVCVHLCAFSFIIPNGVIDPFRSTRTRASATSVGMGGTYRTSVPKTRCDSSP